MVAADFLENENVAEGSRLFGSAREELVQF